MVLGTLFFTPLSVYDVRALEVQPSILTGEQLTTHWRPEPFCSTTLPVELTMSSHTQSSRRATLIPLQRLTPTPTHETLAGQAAIQRAGACHHLPLSPIVYYFFSICQILTVTLPVGSSLMLPGFELRVPGLPVDVQKLLLMEQLDMGARVRCPDLFPCMFHPFVSPLLPHHCTHIYVRTGKKTCHSSR